MMMKRTPFNAKRRRAGFTMLELLLALAITVMVGMAVVIVLTAVSHGLSSASDARSALQRAYAAHARIGAYSKPALAMVDYDVDKGFAMWLHDDRAGGEINLSELRVFWVDLEAGTLSVERVKFPDEWTAEQVEVADVVVPSISNFFFVMETQRGLGYTESDMIADGVDSLTLEWAEAKLVDASRLQLTLDVDVSPEETEPIFFTLALANHKAPL